MYDRRLYPKSTFEKYCQDFPETHAAIMAMFDELMWPGDVFSKYPSVNNIYDMFALATLPDYRGRGLATKLVQQALIIAKKVNEKKKSLEDIENDVTFAFFPIIIGRM